MGSSGAQVDRGPPSAKRRDFAISHVLLEIEGLVFFSEYDVQ